MEPRQNARPSRLRSTCDNCSAAKVKCSKERPTCDRCRNNQRTCMYSASRRHGKQSWQKRVECERAKAADAAMQSMPTTSLPPQGGIDALLGNPRSASVLLTEGQSWDSTDFILNALGGDHNSAQDKSNTLQNPLQFWSQDDFSTALDIADFANSSVLPNNGTPSSLYELSSNLTSPADAFSQADILSSGQNSGQTSSETSASSDLIKHSHSDQLSPTTTTKSNKHDCEARAIAVLRSLAHDSVLDSSAITEDGFESGSQAFRDPISKVPSGKHLTFDKVLLANKTALNVWCELMQCWCAKCPHSTFLYGSVLAKILFWYHEVAAGHCPTSEVDGNVSDKGSQKSPTSQGFPQVRARQFNVRPTVIQIGMLHLNQDEQTNLRRIVLLRELRMVEKTINEALSPNSTIDDDADVIMSSANPHGVWLSKMRDELQDIIQMVKENR